MSSEFIFQAKAREIMNTMCPESKVGVDLAKVVTVTDCEIKYTLEAGGRVTVDVDLVGIVPDRDAYRTLRTAVMDHKNCVNFAGHGLGVFSMHDMATDRVRLILNSSAWI